ncbi:MAG: hypothetical protein J0M00_06120 [Burkholderiales bacterium]|nr:hypothetical protein [Burkholderiales bacterium]
METPQSKGLKNAPYWTDLYYQIVEHYYWSPQRFGRISDASKPARGWKFWRQKLQAQETPLNHIFDVFFHVAPQELLDHVFSAMLQREVSGLELVFADSDLLDPNVVQPDIVVRNKSELIFLEMKVDSKSTVDQFTKYAIAAHCVVSVEPNFKTADLILLTKSARPNALWQNARSLGITDLQSVRDAAQRGLKGASGVWLQRGVQRYLKSQPESLDSICQQVESMGFVLAGYEGVAQTLRAYASTENTLTKLIDGVLQELYRRGLATA